MQGLFETERDPMDAVGFIIRSTNKNGRNYECSFDGFFDPNRVKPRLLTCGPSFLQGSGEKVMKIF
jgi:hypothetical protein